MPLSIILVRPEIPQNVGFVARSMKCYNMSQLNIVGRPKYRQNSYAYKTGFTASKILDKANYYPTLSEALGGIHYAVGFSRRNRESPSERTWDLMDTIPTLDFSQNIGLVYGQESQGLFKEDCALMNKIVKIELPNGDMSLNLAHAVTITLHEIFSHGMLTNNPFVSTKSTSSQPDEVNHQESSFNQREETFQNLIKVLEEKNYFKKKKDSAKIGYLRNLWQRANPDTNEINFILGVLKKLKS